jgi:hypothetical protein
MVVLESSPFPRQELPKMHVNMVLPRAVVGPLRIGAHLALRAPINELDAILSGRDGINQPESPVEPYARLVQAGRLLDALGWSEAEEMLESAIDLSEHGAALAVALDNALKYGQDQSEHPDRQICEQVREAMHTLCGFAMVIDESDLELSRSDPRVHAFHASADHLLAELEREGAE